jgi:hypothetical protein
VWAGDDHLLDVAAELPYQGAPYGPRSGITYFRYWPIKQRFFGMALIEPGLGPQRRRNKRSSQIDEIIDRSLPKVYGEEGSIDVDRITGTPMEFVPLKVGSSKPIIDPGVPISAALTGDINQCDEDIQKALGINEIGLGNAPAGVSAYSAMALISENDAQKLNPIAQRFKLAVADLGRDTFEAMRNWPDGKQMLIAGDDDTLDAVTFERAMLPASFYVRPAKGGTLPRSQASEIQKIADLWNAATVAGVVAQAPQAWIEWYKTSLDEGTSDELPRMDQTNEQRHKAALENIVMHREGQPVPVAPYDDPAVHIPEHDDMLMNLQMAVEEGDNSPETAGRDAGDRGAQADAPQPGRAERRDRPALGPPSGPAERGRTVPAAAAVREHAADPRLPGSATTTASVNPSAPETKGTPLMADDLAARAAVLEHALPRARHRPVPVRPRRGGPGRHPGHRREALTTAMRNPFRRRQKASGADWLITCGPANPKWQVTVGNCDRGARRVRARPAP